MKVEIRYKELYPFYYIDDNGSLDYLHNIDYETLKRWEKVSNDFVKVQLEMAEVTKNIYAYKDKYNFINLKKYEEDVFE